MTRVTVHEYAAALAPRYRAAGRGEKGRILDEFCRTAGMHRKAAIRLLGGVKPLKAGRRPRKRKYGTEVAKALRQLWEVGDRMCGKLLVGAVPTLLEALDRHGELRLGAAEREESCRRWRRETANARPATAGRQAPLAKD